MVVWSEQLGRVFVHTWLLTDPICLYFLIRTFGKVTQMERLWLDPEFTATEEGKRQLRDAILTMHRNDPGRITTATMPMGEEQKTPNGCLQTSAGNCLLRRDMRYIKDQLRQLLEQHPADEVKEPE